MKKYNAPEAETVVLSASDIITSSAVTGYGENEETAQTWSWRKSSI